MATSGPSTGPPTLAPAPSSNMTDPSKTSTNLGYIAPAPPVRMTSKEWVIPPRPKPGRKPATDTPPTKRKAQNRAAQRAFRERRAARVGELEEQLEETKEEQQKRENLMRERIIKLEMDILQFTGELQSWKTRCMTAERIAAYERNEKEAALLEMDYLRKGAMATGAEAVPLPPRRSRTTTATTNRAASSNTASMPSEIQPPLSCGNCSIEGSCACLEETMSMTNTGCGKCTPSSRCQCLETSLGIAGGEELSSKRACSPLLAVMDKRPRLGGEPGTPMEMDFTTSATTSSPFGDSMSLGAMTTTQMKPVDKCGFCEDGTYCVCAESAAATPALEATENDIRLPPLLHEVTPPPSDSEKDHSRQKIAALQPSMIHQAIGAKLSSAKSNPCANGPGTCRQCLADPRSASFCRSLTALKTSASTLPSPNPNASSADGCCGSAVDGTCCKASKNASHSGGSSGNPPPSLTIAETYRTLSTHQDFDAAQTDFNTWLGKLETSTSTQPPQHGGRAAVEVEAASVMGVLKFFDRRFGRG